MSVSTAIVVGVAGVFWLSILRCVIIAGLRLSNSLSLRGRRAAQARLVCFVPESGWYLEKAHFVNLLAQGSYRLDYVLEPVLANACK